MIEYDYSLQVDEGNETREFKPNFPKKIPNISLISGPNSAGKSTLMNIIASGLFGTTTDTVDKSIRRDINDLINSDHKKLSYNIDISSPDNSLCLRITKKSYDSNPVVEESIGKNEFVVLNEEQFKSRYVLIYDIPSNPRERIKELSKIINSDLTEYKQRCEAFTLKCSTLLKEIAESDNSEQIKQLRKVIDKDSTAKDILEEKLPFQNKKLGDLRKLLVAQKLLLAISDKNKKELAYSEAKKLIPDMEAVEHQNYEKYAAAMKGVPEKVASLNTLLNVIKGNLSKICSDPNCDLMHDLDKINFDNVLSTLKLPKCIPTINAVSDYVATMNSKDSMDKQMGYEMFSHMVSLSKSYSKYNIVMPGYGSLSSFISELEDELIKCRQEKNISTYITSVTTGCNTLKSKLFELEQILNKVHMPTKKYDENAYDERQKVLLTRKNDYESSKRELEILSKEASMFEIFKQNLDQVLDDYMKSYPEYRKLGITKLDEAVQHLEMEIARSKSDIQTYEISIPQNMKRLQRLEESKEHPLNDKQNLINEIQAASKNLQTILFQARKKQDAVESGSYGNYGKDDLYFTNLWKYLGKVMGKIHHIDTTYELDSINTVENLIITKDGKIIHINDMGTGQTQGSFLSTILKKNEDRIIIALFDEVSTMDHNTLGILYDEFKKLLSENKLLMAMTVQPSNDGSLKVESI